MNSLRLVTFDVTGTLLQFRIPPPKQYVQVGDHFGVKIDKNIMASNFKTQWHFMSTEHPNFGRCSGLGWEKWWHKLVCLTFKSSVGTATIKDSTLDVIAQHLISNYKTAAYYKVCPGAKDILLYLQTMGIPAGVISNFDPRLTDILDDIKLLEYFKFVITSYEAGVEKPNPRLFQLALKSLDDETILPKQALHVGDKPKLDYLAAVNVGWNAALVHQENPSEVIQQHPQIQPQLIFSNLSDLLEHLSSFSG